MAKQELYGCSATQRPECCKFEANVCCLGCEHAQWCTGQVKTGKTGDNKTLPCVDSDFAPQEVCEFAC